MKSVVNIVYFVRASPLHHRHFQEFISDIDTEFADVTYHNQVRWLSLGNVLKHVFSLHVEPLAFLHDHDREHFDLCDHVWLCKLAFLTDVTKHLNDFNLKLLGQQKLLPDMIMSIEAFKSKLQLFKAHLQAKNWLHFPCLGEILANDTDNPAYYDFVSEIDNLLQNFENRFKECNDLKVHLRFVQTPFSFDPNDFNDTFVTDVSSAQPTGAVGTEK